MFASPFDVKATTINEEAVKIIKYRIQSDVKHYEDNAFVVPYFLNEEEYNVLSDLMKPVPIKTSEKLFRVPHPVANCLNRFAYQECERTAQKFERVIDIGGNPSKTPAGHHICALVNDIKSDARYTESSLFLSKAKALDTGFVDYVTDNHNLCVSGAQNCSWLAEYAYAVNVYDMTLDDIVEIFIKHNLILFDLWIFLPTELIDKNFSADNKIYNYYESNGTSYFDLLDQSDVYIHDTKNWRSFLTTTAIRCKNFGINIEHKMSLGTFTHIRFVRTNKNDTVKRRAYHLPKYVKTIAVPDLVDYYETKKFVVKPNNFYKVANSFVTRLMNWGVQVTDNQFSYNTFHTYANSIKSDVKYQQGNTIELIYEGIDCNVIEFERIVISMFIIVAIHRFKRTQIIGKAFRKMKKDAPAGKLQEYRIKICNYFERIFVDIGWSRSLLETFGESYIYNQELKLPSMIYFEEIHTVKTYHVFINRKRKIHLTGVDNKTDKIIQKTIDDVCQCEIVYDPPTVDITHFEDGDGYCGRNCLIFLNKEFDKILPRTSWWNDEELADACDKVGISYVIHQEGHPIRFKRNKGGPLIKFNLTRSHWYVVYCDCEVQVNEEHFIGDYSDIGLDPNYIYVNSCNPFLTDNGGQSASFRKLFPNYSRGIDQVNEAKHIIYNDYDIILALAHDNRFNRSNELTHKAYCKIFELCARVSNSTGKIVMLPLIGISNYNNSLCCFRTALANYDFKHRLCFYNNDQVFAYEKTKFCTHGGYKRIAGHPIAKNDLIETKYAKFLRDYNVPDRMAKKFEDIWKFLTDFGYIDHLHEVSAAPGAFAEKAKIMGINYTCGYYVGVNATRWNRKIKPNFYFTDLVEHISDLQVDQKSVLLFDLKIDDEDEELIKILLNRKISFIVKFNVFKIPEYYNKMLHMGFRPVLFFNEYSRATSGEVYMFCDSSITSDDDYDNNNNITEAATQRDEDFVEKAKNIECLCEGLESFITDRVNVNLVVTKGDKRVTIPVIDAAPGNRKTMTIVKSTCPKCTLLVAPFKAITTNINENQKMASVIEIAKEIIKKNNFRYIILDEIFNFDCDDIEYFMYNAPDATIFGMGDSDQCKHVDYDNQTNEYRIIQVGAKDMKTFRVPKCISQLFKFDDGRTLISDVEGTLEVDDYDNLENNIKKYDIIICFTQHLAEKLGQKFVSNKVLTAHAAQGITAQRVHLVFADLDAIKHDKFNYIYTAMTRTSQQLIVYADDTTLSKVATIIGSPIERALHAHGVHPHTNIIIEQKQVLVKKHFNDQVLSSTKVTPDQVENILSRIFVPTNDPYTAVLDYKSDIVPNNEDQQRLKFSIDAVNSGQVYLQGKRFSRRAYQRFYHPKNQKQVLDCLITRYAKQTKEIKIKIMDKYVEGFKFWLKNDAMKYMRSKMTHDNIWKYTTDYLCELQKKYPKVDLYDAMALRDPKLDYKTKQLIKTIMEGKANKLTDLEKEWYEKYHYVVTFHLKRQPKEIRDLGYDEKFKAGQGISAWSKLLNVIFSGTIRCYNHYINDVVRDNVQLSYGMSDANLSDKFRKYCSKFNDGSFVKLMADFSEFDSSQEKQGIMGNAILLSEMGCHHSITDLYIEMREKWLLCGQSEQDHVPIRMMLAGKYKQHSGQPDTLDGNTRFNMAVMGMCYDYKNICFAAFKGDDSFIVAENIKKNRINDAYLVDIAGYKIKEVRATIPEYIANIIMPDGTFFPDVIRRVGRLMSKIFTTQMDWDEQKLSIQDSLDVIIDEEHLHHGCQVASLFYDQFNIKISKEEVRVLLNFLNSVKNYDNIDHIPTQMFRIETINSN